MIFKEEMRVIWVDPFWCGRSELCLIVMAVRSYWKQLPVWETTHKFCWPYQQWSCRNDRRNKTTCVVVRSPSASHAKFLATKNNASCPIFLRLLHTVSLNKIQGQLLLYIAENRYFLRNPLLPSHEYTPQDKKYIWLYSPCNFTKSFVYLRTTRRCSLPITS